VIGESSFDGLVEGPLKDTLLPFGELLETSAVLLLVFELHTASPRLLGEKGAVRALVGDADEEGRVGHFVVAISNVLGEVRGLCHGNAAIKQTSAGGSVGDAFARASRRHGPRTTSRLMGSGASADPGASMARAR